jgi:hypothetical protein
MRTSRLRRFDRTASLPAMHRLTIRKTCFALALVTALPVWAAEDLDSVDGPNVRVMRHEDGSQTRFLRSPDNKKLTKKTYSANGRLELVTIYVMDGSGNTLSCKIYDGGKNELYKVRYGYHKSDGRLVEEQMFDSRVKRINPANGQEMPVRRFIYTYDANGKRSAPISLTLIPGKRAEDLYKGTGPSALDTDPFKTPPTAPSGKPRR